MIGVNSTDDFDRLLKHAPAMGKFAEEWSRGFCLFPSVLQDIFYTFYESSPQMLPPKQTSTGAKLNRLIIEQLMKSQEYKRLRPYTRQDIMGSGMVALYFAGLVATGLDPSIIETANEIFIAEQQLSYALTRVKMNEKILRVAEDEGGANIAGRYRTAVEKWRQAVAEEELRLRSLSARLSMQWNTSGTKGIAGIGAQNPSEKQGRFESGAEGLGANKGVWTRGDMTPHLQLVETYVNSPKLKRLVQRVGRLKETGAHRNGRDLLEDSSEVRGIDFGNDLAMVVPEEWAEYFHPRKRTGFKRKYAEESLCLYDMQGKRRRSKGSLIICLDNSGSMQGPKEETSKAIAIALMEIAVAQRRDLVVIMFGGPEDELKVFEVPQGRCTFEQLIEIGEYFLCSAGTDFERPLQEALKYLEKDKYPGGDIIFITDGVCHVGADFLELYRTRKKTRPFQTIGVMVNYGQVSTGPLEVFCDELLMSKDLKGHDVAAQLFGHLQK